MQPCVSGCCYNNTVSAPCPVAINSKNSRKKKLVSRILWYDN